DAALPPVMMGAESVTVRSDNVTELDDVLLLETEGETALAPLWRSALHPAAESHERPAAPH
ncbi:hypothetical protein FK514_27575, partial [Klebsiella pneumoniae]|nr:hypothetical protein [Klebsiella pneumoniae]